MVPFKRRKLVCSAAGSHTGAPGSHEGATGSHEGATGSHEGTRFPQVVLFLLERKMGASRRRFLSQLGEKKGFQVEQLLSERVTHVICENNSSEEVRTWLRSEVGGQTAAHLLDVSWFTESMKAGRPVEVLDRHKLQEQQTEEVEVFSTPSYACQRRTTLDNHNAVLTDALSLLAENAELSGEDGRGVAFRRAAAALKALPLPVTRLTQLGGVPCLGGHSLRVIKDVLESGASPEVEALRRSERFKALKVLTGIFGVGVKTAGRWIGEGILTLRQLRDSGPTLNRAQRAGLRHYDDLNRPVGRAEAAAVAAVVEAAAGSVLPGARVTLIGGFRRGKQTGHDVDFLITHPEEGREAGLMPKLVSWLDSQGFLLYQKTNSNSYLEATEGPARPASNMDRFERCFSVFKLPEEAGRGGAGAGGAGAGGEGGPRPWRAVRVDLVVSPVSQFAFALLGWTGSKLFERELRRWAGHEMNMCLSSHALYDHRQSRYLRASSEEEIFAHLGLEYIPPSERNA